MGDTTPAPAKADKPRDPTFTSTTATVFGRDISYIDAVYGFAATLLISNVDAPPPEAWQSFSTLAASGAAVQALGFVLSFTVIAVFWRANVRLVNLLTGLDSPTTILNLAAAASVIFISFTTQGIADPNSTNLALPTVLYAANLALVSLFLTIMLQVARARGLLRHPTTSRQNLADILAVSITPVVFLASIPIALTWGAVPARLFWASLLVLAPAAGILSARLARETKVEPSA
ncbi:hypothetical protein BH10ACT7_BH10ACT7_04090 [soil metagenome]